MFQPRAHPASILATATQLRALLQCRLITQRPSCCATRTLSSRKKSTSDHCCPYSQRQKANYVSRSSSMTLGFHSSCVLSRTESDSEFVPPEPHFNWDYLCNPDNKHTIEENIVKRKGIGDINLVVSC